MVKESSLLCGTFKHLPGATCLLFSNAKSYHIAFQGGCGWKHSALTSQANHLHNYGNTTQLVIKKI